MSMILKWEIAKMGMHLEVQKVGEGYVVDVVGGEYPRKFKFATGGELSAFMKGWGPDTGKSNGGMDLYKELTENVRHALCEFNDPDQTVEYCVAQMWIGFKRLEKRLSDALAELEKPERLISVTSPYGLCPTCNGVGVDRERRPNGNDTCVNRHTYPSADALYK